MSCRIPADLTNGTDSNIFNKMMEIYNGDESRAKQAYSYFRTPKFLERFGNYSEALANQTIPKDMIDRLDPDTFEPLIMFDETLQKHYFLDKFNERIFYPFDRQGLNGIFETNEIKEFAKSLAFTFYDKYLTFDIDTLEFKNVGEVTLKTFIEEFTEEVGETLMENAKGKYTDEQISLGVSLLDSLDFVSEWEKEVTTIFNSFKLDVVADEESDTDHIRERAEETKDDLVRPESFLKDSKDNVNNNIKLYLSLIKREQENMFGLPKFVEFGDIYTSLNKALVDLVSTVDENGNPEDLFDTYKEKIRQLGETKPYFKGLYDALNQELGSTELFRNQIVSAFRLSYNNFLGSERYVNKQGEIEYSVKNLSEVSSRRKQLVKQWSFNFSEKFYKDGKFDSPLSRIEKNYNNFRTIKRNISAIEQLFEPLSKDESSVIETLISDLEYVGINLNAAGKLSDNDVTRDVQKGLLFFLDNLNLEGSSLEDKKTQILNLYDSLTRGIQRLESKASGNLFTDQALLNDLAEAEAFFQEEGTDASIFTVGKTKWVYSLPSYLSEKINAWKKQPRLLFLHYTATPYNKGSEFMKFYLGIDKVTNAENLTYEEWEANYAELSKVRLEKIELSIFNSSQSKGDATNADDSKTIGELDATVDYMNKLLAFKSGGKVYHKTALAADKSTEYQLHYGNALSKASGITRYDYSTNTYNINTGVLEIFYNYFKSEYERMAKEYENIQNLPDSEKIANYHTNTQNALKSQLFPSMSISIDKQGNITLPEDSELADLYDPETGEAHLATLDGHKDIIINKIKKILSQNINDVHKQMLSDGIFVINPRGEYANIALDSTIYNTYKSEEQYEGMATKTMVGDMLVNSIISQVEYSKMFTGDTAYYKNMVDYKKRVPASYTDGLYLNIADRKEVYFNTAIIDSVEVPAPFIEELEELLGEEGADIVEYYRKINAADAQAWITPQRWKFIKQKLGKWSAAKDEVLYSKMMDSNATFSPEELKRLAQPLKGVYFDIVNGAPRYLKYSQAVLLPKLIAGTPLQKLYDKMIEGSEGKDYDADPDDYNKQIHEVITKDGIKVGAQGVTTGHTKEGDLADNLELNSFQLTNAGWKLQQDLSPKGFKETEIGSQIMKIIFQGLVRNQNKEFYVGNRTMKGSEVIDEIHSIVSDLSDRGIKSLFNKFGINPDTFEIENEDKLYASMIDDLSKRRDTADNTLKALQARTSPYGIPGQFQIFQNVFSSAVNKAAVKIKTNGGSFIQMADFGISRSEALKNENGIRFAPWFDQPNDKLHTPKKYTDAEGRERVRPGGVFISGSFIAKLVPNYRELSDKELFGIYNAKRDRYEGGLIDERILRNIVGYRIPNQGLPSNDAFHVMGILPEDAADTIIAYTGITTKTGSDFDIDKMYIMMPSYFTEKNDNGEVTKLKYASARTTKTVEGDIVEKPLHEQPIEVVKNKLIEAYVSVLTSKHAIHDIMKPIDEPFVEDDIKNMYPEVQRNDMMDFDAISDVKLKEEFKLGKAGLGQNVNALTDSVFGSMAQLELFQVEIPGAHSGVHGVKFDEEYSKELSDDNLASYVESYNEFNPDAPIRVEDIKHLQKIKLNDAMKALVNGFVDIAKDPFITRGGWNTQTNDVGFLLVRAGVHPFYINSFLGQPIIKEYTRFVDNNESKTLDNTNGLKEQFLIKKAKDRFVEEFPDNTVTINGVTLTAEGIFDSAVPLDTIMKFFNNWKKAKNERAEEMVEDKLKGDIRLQLAQRTFGISFHEENAEADSLSNVVYNHMISTLRSFMSPQSQLFEKDLKYFRGQIKEADDTFQMGILAKFFEYVPLAKNLNRSNKGSKATTDGKGKNIGSLLVANNYIRDILKQEIEGKQGALIGFATKLKRNGKDTYLNRIIKNSILTPYKIMRANPKYFLTAKDEYVSSFNYISYKLYENRLQDQKLADELEKAHQSYVMSGFAPLVMPKEEKIKLLNELPSQLAELKTDPVFKNNTLIDTLYVKEGVERAYIAMPNNKKSPSFKNTLTDAWRHILEQRPEFGENLIKYSFFISGFNMSINQFHDFIPYEWFNRHGFNSYIRTLGNISYPGNIDLEFASQFHRHMADSSKYTKRVFDRKKLEGVRLDEAFSVISENPSHFVYVQEEVPDHAIQYGDEQEADKEYYELIGTAGSIAYYVRTTPLGNLDKDGNKIVEYNINARSRGDRATSLVHSLPAGLRQEKIKEVINKYGESFSIDPSVMVNESDTRDVIELIEEDDSNDVFTKPC